MNEAHYPANTANALSMMREDKARVMDKKRRLADEASAKAGVVSSARSELQIVMGVGPGGSGQTAGAKRVAEAEAKVAAAKVEASRRRDIAREFEVECEASIAALQRCGTYLERRDIAGKPLRPHPGTVKPKRRSGETPLATVTRVRGDIENLKAELSKIAARPLPSRDAKAAARQQIEALAVSNPPDVVPLLNGAPMRLPKYDLRPSGYGGQPIAYGVPDTMALLAWSFEAAILAEIDKAIDAAADDKIALTAEQKAKAISRLGAETLETERIEEALIEGAYAEGQFIIRRPDADPLAILWLASDMPAPK